jgi:hypothetical protein
MPTYYEQYTTTMDQALRSLEITGTDGESLGFEAGFERFCELSRKVRESGRKQYLCGNGASAAFANHMALDWTKNGGIPTHSFSDSALLTALGNDLGYEESFSAPLGWYAKPGDQLVTISSSGNSPNIIRAINPHFPALRADPLALSGASRRKQTPSRQKNTACRWRCCGSRLACLSLSMTKKATDRPFQPWIQ